MIPKPKYKRLLKAVKAELDNQHGNDFIAITQGRFSIGLKVKMGDREQFITDREVAEAWPYIVKELGLVDDGTKTDTWTLPGHGITPEAIEQMKATIKDVIKQVKQ